MYWREFFKISTRKNSCKFNVGLRLPSANLRKLILIIGFFKRAFRILFYVLEAIFYRLNMILQSKLTSFNYNKIGHSCIKTELTFIKSKQRYLCSNIIR
jgi:hypothetical protein